VSALVLAHCHSVASGILDTTVESFDRHFAVNARAAWLLIQEFGRRFKGGLGRGRIISLTSDHVAGNMPYGASKGALDRITLAAARELAHLGITANAINPGATDTGWMSAEQMAAFAREIPLGRVSRPEDCANLVSFLCSEQGGWINGQLLHSNGGVQ
jgi:3-oxoacyl-[acyl-carrier protein] reductase